MQQDLQKKIIELGLTLPPTPKPQGSYIAAVKTGNLIFVSGQLPMQDGVLMYAGKVGKDLDIFQGQLAARLCFMNILAAIGRAEIELNQLTRVIRLGGFVQCVDGFVDQPKVINGASDLCHAIFGEAGVHARVAVGVSALPLNAAVEIEALFEFSA